MRSLNKLVTTQARHARLCVYYNAWDDIDVSFCTTVAVAIL